MSESSNPCSCLLPCSWLVANRANGLNLSCCDVGYGGVPIFIPLFKLEKLRRHERVTGTPWTTNTLLRDGVVALFSCMDCSRRRGRSFTNNRNAVHSRRFQVRHHLLELRHKRGYFGFKLHTPFFYTCQGLQNVQRVSL